jgi:hypothetical protein
MSREYKPSLLEIITGAEQRGLALFSHRRKPGVLDKRCLLQDLIWVDVQGRVHQIADMTNEYRANVLTLLSGHAPGWLLEAAIWLRIEQLAGLHEEALSGASRMDAADGPPTWMLATPLVRRLQLPAGETGDTPRPAPVELHDRDTGLWHVATVTADYRLDLDNRRLQRRPRTTAPKFIRVDTRESVVRRSFDIDTTWVRLEGLVQCHVLLPLLARIEYPSRGIQPLSSTLVKSVTPLRDNEEW